MKAQKDQDLADKLNQLIILTASQAVSGMETTREKAIFLAKLGLDRNQIALACNSTPGSISVEISNAKRKGLLK
ncbi:MAG: hypothetical protein IH995_03915 [Proteobacteria bacterium]|nr:hypothetical protein [Pseudomonadota bacterium]